MFYAIMQILGGCVIAWGDIPQIMKMIHSRSAHDLSFSAMFFILLGDCITLIYAIHVFATCGIVSILVTNIVYVILSACVFALTAWYQWLEKRQRK